MPSIRKHVYLPCHSAQHYILDFMFVRLKWPSPGSGQPPRSVGCTGVSGRLHGVSNRLHWGLAVGCTAWDLTLELDRVRVDLHSYINSLQQKHGRISTNHVINCYKLQEIIPFVSIFSPLVSLFCFRFIYRRILIIILKLLMSGVQSNKDSRSLQAQT